MDKLDLRDDSELKSKELGAGNTTGCINGVVSSGGTKMSKNMQNMKDQEVSSSLGKHTGPQQTINRSNTSKHGAKRNFVDIEALVRSVQRAEGNRDCFRRGQVHCDQTDCVWRPYCLESHKPL